MLDTLIGGLAAFCTTVSYIPQVKKAWATQETGDLSLKMLLILSAGLALWIVYGALRSDWVIIIANSVSLTMLATLVWFKMRETSGGAAATK